MNPEWIATGFPLSRVKDFHLLELSHRSEWLNPGSGLNFWFLKFAQLSFEWYERQTKFSGSGQVQHCLVSAREKTGDETMRHWFQFVTIVLPLSATANWNSPLAIFIVAFLIKWTARDTTCDECAWVQAVYSRVPVNPNMDNPKSWINRSPVEITCRSVCVILHAWIKIHQNPRIFMYGLFGLSGNHLYNTHWYFAVFTGVKSVWLVMLQTFWPFTRGSRWIRTKKMFWRSSNKQHFELGV